MQKINNGTRIAFLGDSLVNGACDEAMLGWTGRLCTQAKQKGHFITYYNLGIRGDTSENILLRWESEVSIRLPQGEGCRVVLSMGINDVVYIDGVQRVSLVNSIENAKTLLLQITRQYELIMVGPPPVLDKDTSHRIEELSNKFKLLCNDAGVRYIDVYSLLKGNELYLGDINKGDGYHPGGAGYMEITKVINTSGLWWY